MPLFFILQPKTSKNQLKLMPLVNSINLILTATQSPYLLAPEQTFCGVLYCPGLSSALMLLMLEQQFYSECTAGDLNAPSVCII